MEGLSNKSWAGYKFSYEDQVKRLELETMGLMMGGMLGN